MEKLSQLHHFCQQVLPAVYDDSISYYELLCKVVHYYNSLVKNQNDIIAFLTPFITDFAELKKEMGYLSDELEKVKNGDYVSLYIDSLAEWVDKNLQEMVSKIVKYVFFGISQDGYFVASVPKSWEFLHFDTIVEPDSELYGHLVLSW